MFSLFSSVWADPDPHSICPQIWIGIQLHKKIVPNAEINNDGLSFQRKFNFQEKFLLNCFPLANFRAFRVRLIISQNAT